MRDPSIGNFPNRWFTLLRTPSGSKKPVIMEVKHDMGEQTFSAEDVIRIYAFYLDESEQKTVEEFFETFIEEMDTSFLADLLEILERILSIFLTGRITALALTFGTATNLLLQAAQRELRSAISGLGQILPPGGTDA